MSAAAVTTLAVCAVIALVLNGRQLAVCVAAVRRPAVPLGAEFLAAEIWLVGTLGLLASVFSEVESAAVAAGWAVGWIFVLAWVLRDAVLWRQLLTGRGGTRALRVLLSVTSAVMALILAAAAIAAIGALIDAPGDLAEQAGRSSALALVLPPVWAGLCVVAVLQTGWWLLRRSAGRAGSASPAP